LHDEELINKIRIVKIISSDIKMEFGLQKCARARFIENNIGNVGNTVEN
jgi:hypothetical protein